MGHRLSNSRRGLARKAVQKMIFLNIAMSLALIAFLVSVAGTRITGIEKLQKVLTILYLIIITSTIIFTILAIFELGGH